MAGEAAGFTTHARGELAKVIVGQRDVLDQLLAVLLCGGHALVEGVPGTAKTLAIKALARICRLEFQNWLSLSAKAEATQSSACSQGVLVPS